MPDVLEAWNLQSLERVQTGIVADDLEAWNLQSLGRVQKLCVVADDLEAWNLQSLERVQKWCVVADCLEAWHLQSLERVQEGWCSGSPASSLDRPRSCCLRVTVVPKTSVAQGGKGERKGAEPQTLQSGRLLELYPGSQTSSSRVDYYFQH